jgi:hypothetical protein
MSVQQLTARLLARTGSGTGQFRASRWVGSWQSVVGRNGNLEREITDPKFKLRRLVLHPPALTYHPGWTSSRTRKSRSIGAADIVCNARCVARCGGRPMRGWDTRSAALFSCVSVGAVSFDMTILWESLPRRAGSLRQDQSTGAVGAAGRLGRPATRLPASRGRATRL